MNGTSIRKFSKLFIFLIIILVAVVGIFYIYLSVKISLDIEQIPPKIMGPIEFTETLVLITSDSVGQLKEITTLIFQDANFPVAKIYQSSKEGDILIVYDNGMFQHWNINTQEILSDYDFENATEKGISFSGDGSIILSAGKFNSDQINSFSIWDSMTGNRIYCEGLNCPDRNSDLIVAEDGIFLDPSGKLVIEYTETVISVFDYGLDISRSVIWNIDFPDDNKYPHISNAAIDPQGVYFVYALKEGILEIFYFDEVFWTPNDGYKNTKALGSYKEENEVTVIDLAFDNTRTWLGSLNQDELLVWDLRKSFFTQHMKFTVNNGNTIAFDHSGDLISIGTEDGIQIYDLAKKIQLAEFEVGHVTSLYFSIDNRLLIWGDLQGNIHLWGVPQD